MKFILPKARDLRFVHLAEIAAANGYEVITYENELPAERGVFFLPLNLCEAELLAALESIPDQSTVFAGKGCDAVARLAKEKNLRITCLLDEKRYLIKNAEHTAEGVLAEIISRTDRRLDELCLLVYGYGNCGRAIARLLWLCGCEVWVWSRERGQALAEKDGFNLFPATERGLGMFDGVVNTVPAPIFSADFLGTMQKGSSFFQVASGNSGIDPDEAKARGIRFIPLHGLPGKYTPASEADAIWEEVIRALSIKRSIL